MLLIPEQAIVFRPLDIDQWRGIYQSAISVCIKWDKIKVIKVGIKMLNLDDIVYLPHYKNGDWIDGTPETISPGDNLALIRIPGLKVNGKYIIFDGCHRIKQLKPKIVIIDYIETNKKSHKYFIDLHNPFWMGK